MEKATLEHVVRFLHVEDNQPKALRLFQRDNCGLQGDTLQTVLKLSHIKRDLLTLLLFGYSQKIT